MLVANAAAKEGGKKRSRTTQETAQEKHMRIQKSQTRKIRKLSAWNAFQRDRMQGLSLGKEQYQAKVREISAEWRRMTEEERTPYQIEAEHQQLKLDELAATPLPSKSTPGTPDAHDAIWKNGAKKLSSRRLRINQQDFDQHAVWNLPTQFGESPSAPAHHESVFSGCFGGQAVVIVCSCLFESKTILNII